MTVYLKFASESEAVSKMENAGFTLSDYRDNCQSEDGWGVLFQIPETAGWFANLYDCDCPATLTDYRVADPATPYNVRA